MWLNDGRAQPASFRLEAGAFILFRREGTSAIGWLSPTGVSEPKPVRDKLLAHFGFNLNGVEFRVIGDPSLVDGWTLCLAPWGLRAGKHADLPRPSELLFLPEEGRVRVRDEVVAAAPAPVSIAGGTTKVLIVDDSATIRRILRTILSADAGIEIVGDVDHPHKVEEAIRTLKPDVITLDIHMPDMDGVTLLKQYLPKYPVPTVMISALSTEDGSYVLDALEAGAVDYIQKPSLAEIEKVAPRICEKIKDARHARLAKREVAVVRRASIGAVDSEALIAIGSSTGGTEALKAVFTRMPDSIPAVLVVQHIPAVFSKAFANRMNDLCSFTVKEAEDGDLVEPNKVLIAPGGYQMKVVRRGAELRIKIEDAPAMNRHKPSVDFLFDSIAELKPKKLVAAILTGMGADGARGLKKLRDLGASTFAQDEASCVVFGMPKEAIRLGGAGKVVPLSEMAQALMSASQRALKKTA